MADSPERDIAQDFRDLYAAYQEQVAVDRVEYVDAYKVMTLFRRAHKVSEAQFIAMLQANYVRWLVAGYSIALEVDYNPTRHSQIARRKGPKIIVDGFEVYVIAMRAIRK